MGYVERRKTDRQNQLVPATLRSVHGDVEVMIRNLSSVGVMVDGISGLAIGEGISLTLPNIGWVHATVAWSIESRAGLAFAGAIDPQLVLEVSHRTKRATLRA